MVCIFQISAQTATKKDSLDTKTSSETAEKKVSMKKYSKDAITDIVKYSAKDSIVFYASGEAYLYGEAKVGYQTMELTSDHIMLNTDSSVVHARSGVDSTGNPVNMPVFKDGAESYESESIDFNFKTKKGLIRNVVTQQGDGYVTSEKAKKMEDNTFLMKNAKYTTCDNHKHPHFYLNLTKAKVKPKEYIVAGPAYLVIQDVPLPLALPFGFFPFTEKYTSGILMPTFGEESSRGFYLRNAGYYFAINKYFDMALRADLYTNGSWGANATVRYKKIYKFNGDLFLGYQSTVNSDKTLPDYTQTNDLKIIWTHSQDPKANPFSSFSASINYTSTSYNKNNVNSYYNPSLYGENNKSSSINYTYKFPESPFTLTTNFTLNQRQSDSTISLKLPTINLNMSRVYPFKKKVKMGKEKWYEKIYLNYSLNMDNYISTKQDKLFEANLLNDWNNGIKNQLNIGASYTLFKYIIFTPSLNYNEKWYFKKVYRQWNEIEKKEEKSYKNGFYRINDMSANLSVSTQLYGFYQPIWGKKIKMIRHVVRPSASLSFSPKMDEPWPSFGQNYYDEYLRKLSDGSFDTIQYNYFSENYYGGPTSNGGGRINLSLTNNLEMKVASDKDSTGYKKISLIDNLTLNTSYDLFAEEDEAPWSDISANLRLKITPKVNLNVTAGFCPYTYKLDAHGLPYKSNLSEWERNGRIVRLTNARTSFNYSFSNNTFKKKKEKTEEEEELLTEEELAELDPNSVTLDDLKDQQVQKNEKEAEKIDPDGYAEFSLPWTLNVSYSIAYGNYTFNKEKLEYDRRLTQTLNFSGSINFSPNWSFTFSSGYDFLNKEMAYTSCGVRRKLHCWSASLDFIPFGLNQGFNFHIGVNSSMLQDLKYEKRTSGSDYPMWY
jgi:lipopolysaccharide assembly outer membrane protein LptD (OstA)